MSLESPDILCNIGYDPSGRSANFAQDTPEILPAQLQCSENGGDTTCTGDDTTTQRIQPDRGEASEGIGSNDTTTETTSDNRDQPQVKADEEGPQDSRIGPRHCPGTERAESYASCIPDQGRKASNIQEN